MKKTFAEILKSMQPGEVVMYDGEELQPEGPSLETKVSLLATHYLRLEERIEALEALLAQMLPKNHHQFHYEGDDDPDHHVGNLEPPDRPKEDPSYR